jgi:hypothetical protein
VRDGDGTKSKEERAKVAGACMIAYGKFQPSAILGEVSQPVTSPEIADGWNFPYAIMQAPATFARLPSFVRTTIISHIIVVGRGITSYFSFPS